MQQLNTPPSPSGPLFAAFTSNAGGQAGRGTRRMSLGEPY